MLFVLLFYGAFSALRRAFQSEKLASNGVSFLNTNVAIGLSTATLLGYLPYEYLQTWLTSYFLYDSVSIMLGNKIRFMDTVYLLHHGLSIITLCQSQMAAVITRLFLVAELSNWPMYIVKHLIETKRHEHLQLWKTIQFGMYAPLRIVGIGSFFVMVEGANFVKVIGLPIYAMGAVWSYKLWRGLNKNKDIHH